MFSGIKYSSLVLCWLILSGPACRTATKVKQSDQPNIVFILADDLGWRDLGCYGSDFYQTPRLDAFARSGMRFTNAYAASPLCSPTRASILTGQEPGRLRFTAPNGHLERVILEPKETSESQPYHKTATPQTRTRLPNDYLTFPEILQSAGYRTAFMGKWHLGRDPYIPENQGFEVVVGGREHPGPPGPGHFFAPWDCETLPVVPEGTHIAEVLTDEAIHFMEQNTRQPFLLCLWYYDVHAPFQAKAELREQYADRLTPDHIQRSPTMGAMIETMDTQIGRVLESLDKLGLSENTIVVFTSDNGGNMYDGPDGVTPTNNFPLRAGKGSNYEGGTRVPLIVRAPGITTPNATSAVVTSTVDHYPTLLEMVQLPFPREVLTDGLSYTPALKGKDYDRAPIYSTFCHNVVATGNRANISMREGPWRLYKFYFDGPARTHRYELYNLEADIGEQHNLSESMPDRVRAMNAKLDAHAAEAGILLPQKNENYEGTVLDAWQVSDVGDASLKERVLYLKNAGPEAAIETVYTPNVNQGAFLFQFDMRSASSGSGSLAWTERGNNADPKTSVLDGIHDGGWHTYQLPVKLEGVLNTLRLKPASGSGSIELRRLKLLTPDGHYIRDWPMY